MVRPIRPARDLRHLRQIKAALRELRPDIVHTHSSKGGVLGRRASLSTGIGARVHTPHTFAFLFGALFGRAKRAVFRSIERSLASSTHRVIAVSSSEGPATIEGLGGGRSVHPQDGPQRHRSGAGRGRSSRRPREPRPGTPGSRSLRWSGSSTRRRGKTSPSRPSPQRGWRGLQVLFVGPGDQGPLMELAEHLGVQRRVAFTGAREDVPGDPRRVGLPPPALAMGGHAPTWSSRPWRPRVRWWGPRRWTGPGTSSRTA